ncbi:MAG: flagellin [Pseudomonadota bacterium]
MTSSILTNSSAMIALQNLRNTNSQLSDINNQISTGKKVASARDNAAVFAISQVMESDVAGFQAITESLSLGSSTLAVASNATTQIGELLNEIKGKVVAANEENVDRPTLQNEIDQLRDQITGIVDAAQFNGLNLLKNDETISVLSSLDRSSTGEVTASSVSVEGLNFTTDAGAAGTQNGGRLSTLSGTGLTASDQTITLTSSASFLDLDTTATESFAVNVGGIEIEVTGQKLADEGLIASATTDATDENVLDYVAAAINGTLSEDNAADNLGFNGVTAVRQANPTTAANAEIVISSTSGTSITTSADAANATGAVAAGGATATLSGVQGQTNTGSTVTLDLVDSEASADGQTLSVTLGENTFTYTSDNTPANSAAEATAAVEALNADAAAQGVRGVVFQVNADNNTAIDVVNLDSTSGGDVTFSTTFGTNAGNITQSATQVDAATAGSVGVNVSGNVVEGDTFSVNIGGNTATYVAGADENVNDVVRGLQAVIAAEGPAGVSTVLSFAADPASDTATISIASDTGETVSLSENRGGTESTGDLFGLSTIDVTTGDGATRALDTIESLIQINIDAQAEFGASERRLEIQSDFMSSLIDSFKSGIGALVDADLEEASARLQALQVQQQLGVQALSIANQAPQNILALFR